MDTWLHPTSRANIEHEPSMLVSDGIKKNHDHETTQLNGGAHISLLQE